MANKIVVAPIFSLMMQLSFLSSTTHHNLLLGQNKMVASMGGAAQMMSMLPGMGGGIDKKQIAEVSSLCAQVGRKDAIVRHSLTY